MILPSQRFLLYFFLATLPAALAPLLLPSALAPGLLIFLGFLLVAVIDAIRSVNALDPVRVMTAPIARISKDREGFLDVHLWQESSRGLNVKLGMPWPAEIKSPYEFYDVQLDRDPTKQIRLSWPCQSGRRGRYLLEKIFLETLSPWKLWHWRTDHPFACEVRVYPNLMKEKQTVAALFLNRPAAGVHSRRIVGKGRDFEKLREYVHGDSTEDIHWKATAKRSAPVTKVFQVERTQEVYVVIDSSRLSGRLVTKVPLKSENAGEQPSELETVLERFVSSALILGLAARKQGDLFGLLHFSSGVDRFLRAKGGKNHYITCVETLHSLQPSDTTPDFDEVFTFVRLQLRRRALLIFLISLDDPVLSESFIQKARLISRQHLVLVLMVKPPGMQPLFEEVPESAAGIYDQLAGHIRWQSVRELKKQLKKIGIEFLLVDHQDLSGELVSQYVNIKQRQSL